MDANTKLIDFIMAAVDQMEADEQPIVGFAINTPEGKVSFRLEITDFELFKETLQ